MSKQLLQESFKVSLNTVKKIPLNESNQIVEANGKTFPCRGAYEFPVWRLDEKNLNERIYSKKLAEQVISNGKITSGLANHPKEDVDVSKTFCVERNPHIRDGIMWVDAFLVGEKGQLAKEVLGAGGELGLSSSAFGDVDKVGNVLSEGFEIERYADWVDQPSYEVFVSSKNTISKDSDSQFTESAVILGESSEKLVQENEVIKKNSTNVTEDQKEVITMQEKKLSLEEKNLRIGVRALFKEAARVDSPRDQVELYKQILEYCNGEDFAKDYIEEAQSKIDEINENLHKLAEVAKAKEEEVKSLEESKKASEDSVESLKTDVTFSKKNLEEATEKLDVAYDLLDNMKVREKKLKEMYDIAHAEKNGMVSASEYKELQLYVEELEDELKTLKTSLIELKSKIRGRKTPTVKNKRIRKTEDDMMGDDFGSQSIMQSTDMVVPIDEDDVADVNDVMPDYSMDADMDSDSSMMDTDSDMEMDIETEDSDVVPTVPNPVDDLDTSDYVFPTENLDVQNYYEDLLDDNPNYRKIEKEIKRCRTVIEAQKVVLNLKDLVEEVYTPMTSQLKRLSERKESQSERPRTSPVMNKLLRKGWE